MIVVLDKICKKCKDGYPPTTEYFPPRKRYKNGLSSWCRKCERKQGLKHYYLHHEQCLKSTRQWRKTIRGHLLSIYREIKQRCENPFNKSYKNYGGRGIKCLFKTGGQFVLYVTDILRVDPRNLDIDRINNNGHYEHGNIRFITHKENLANRRKTLQN